MAGEGDEESTRFSIPLRYALTAALALLVAVRLIPFGSVFRGADVVLLSNDPYVFLYLVERALTEGAISRANPDIFWRGEPLLIWTLAFFSLLLGGVEQADFVLAWYPVVTALLSGVLVFVLTRTLTDDVRMALASVVVLAVTPLHVSRTALGFADHHAFDYFWLILTATALVWLVVRTDAERRRRWQVGAVLGLAVAGQTLAWQASPLMMVPTAIGVGIGAVVLVRTEEPTRALAPVVGGFGLAALLVQPVHQLLHWQSTVVAGTPVLLFFGGLVLLGLVEFVDRRGGSWPMLLVGELATLAIAVVALVLVAPGFVEEAVTLATDFGAYVERLQGSGIGETTPITAAFGPLIGPLILLGFGIFLGLPAAVWGLVHGWREREAGWFVLATYVGWFFVLAFVQRRFAVQLGLFLSVFAGVGFVGFAHWLALLRSPVPVRDEPPEEQPLVPPERERLALLGGLGAVGIGGGALFSGVILSRVTIEESAYRAAAWMREYAADRDWNYPQNYVLAAWGRVRMFNYFVNGEARQYVYAREHYEDFIFGTDTEGWYEEFRNRVGFLVTRERDGAAAFHVQTRLHRYYGGDSRRTDGVDHFRAMWESDDGGVKVFTLVPGVTLTGRSSGDEPPSFSTQVTLAGSGRTFTYSRQAEPRDDGTFTVNLPHPGEYTVKGRDESLTVDEDAVMGGAERSLDG